jgi:hypothetical protein
MMNAKSIPIRKVASFALHPLIAHTNESSNKHKKPYLVSVQVSNVQFQKYAHPAYQSENKPVRSKVEDVPNVSVDGTDYNIVIMIIIYDARHKIKTDAIKSHKTSAWSPFQNWYVSKSNQLISNASNVALLKHSSRIARRLIERIDLMIEGHTNKQLTRRSAKRVNVNDESARGAGVTTKVSTYLKALMQWIACMHVWYVPENAALCGYLRSERWSLLIIF